MTPKPITKNTLFYGDHLQILRENLDFNDRRSVEGQAGADATGLWDVQGGAEGEEGGGEAGGVRDIAGLHRRECMSVWAGKAWST